MKLKKINFAILLLTLSLYACSKNKELTFGKLNPADFKAAGSLHNKNLDKIFHVIIEYKAVKNQANNNKYSKGTNGSTTMRTPSEQEAFLNIAENETNLYIQTLDVNNNINTQMIGLTTSVFDGVPLSSEESLYNSTTASLLLPSQTSLLDEINVVLTDNDESISSCINRINTVEAQVATLNLTEEQQAQMYTATNSAKSSLEYWYGNIDEWSSLLSNSQGISSMSVNNNGTTIKVAKPFSWKKVAKGDVAGAVAGAAAWGGAWVFGGPATWSAFGISVGGWAAGCSAYEAIQQLW